jgi:hypothetical protein
MPWVLYFWGKIPQYPLDRGLSGTYGQSGCDGEENKIPASVRNRVPVVKPIA